MSPSSTFLNTKFGRRMFLLFAGCALMPILGLAMVSYTSVHHELLKQADARLAATSKSLAMGILERLAILDAELQIVVARLETVGSLDLVGAGSVMEDGLSNRFRGIVRGGEGVRAEVLLGRGLQPPELSPEEVVHLELGRPLLKIASQGEEPLQILLVRNSGLLGDVPSLIWGEIEPAYLWWGAGRETTLPVGYELVVLDSGRSVQMCNTFPGARALPAAVLSDIGRGSHGGFSWEDGGSRYLGHYRLMNLLPVFHYPNLTLVISEPEELVARPLTSFKRAFLAVTLATLVVVLLLTSRQIRSSLVPLERLRHGTRRVAAGDFGVSVSVETDDEFAELAQSFNSMARSLERQFETLKSLNELQQTVLSALKIDRMVNTVLEQFGRVFPCRAVSVTVINPDRAGAGLIYHEKTSSIQTSAVDLVELTAPEMVALEANRQHLVVDLSRDKPSFMPRACGPEAEWVIAFPAFLEDELAAIVAASSENISDVSERDFAAARQVTDQVAIGLANTRLIHELDNLNWSTLSALARAIDVRSPWTMGHTERVTRLARQIGQAMSLSKQRLDTLHRGSLLHDIGKIGVRSEVLDKASALDPAEMEEIRDHARLGARIIEPIPGLADAIPVVLQHHEWFNGEGYPAGLAGDEICLEARILAVADSYDALRSERPYRGALDHEEVMGHLEERAGTQFDPRIVEVFAGIMATAGLPRRPGREVPLPIRSQIAS